MSLSRSRDRYNCLTLRFSTFSQIFGDNRCSSRCASEQGATNSAESRNGERESDSAEKRRGRAHRIGSAARPAGATWLTEAPMATTELRGTVLALRCAEPHGTAARNCTELRCTARHGDAALVGSARPASHTDSHTQTRGQTRGQRSDRNRSDSDTELNPHRWQRAIDQESLCVDPDWTGLGQWMITSSVIASSYFCLDRPRARTDTRTALDIGRSIGVCVATH